MILELKIQNFLSFKDEVTFSFEATSDKTHEDYYITEVIPGVRVLKLAIVYGANASGKTNLIEAFDFIKAFVSRYKRDKSELTGHIPFLLCDKNNEPGKFELTFFADGKKYKYYLCLDRNKVLEEKLSFYPGSQPAVLFYRTYDKKTDSSIISFGSKVNISKVAVEEISLKVLRNTSFFLGYGQVNYTVPEIETAYNWFNEQFLDTINPKTQLTEYTTNRIKSDEKLRKFAIEFLRNGSFNISDLKIETDYEPVPEHLYSLLEKADMTENEKEEIRTKGLPQNHAEFEHLVVENGIKSKYYLHEGLQSQGTMRYYGFSAPFHEAYTNHAFLAIDEVEASMHAHLVKHLVTEYLMGCRKYANVQLLLTTHNTSLLNDKEILRKDAIWFTEKQENGATELYSLSDFDIRKELSYFNAYNVGKFGAIPNLD